MKSAGDDRHDFGTRDLVAVGALPALVVGDYHVDEGPGAQTTIAVGRGRARRHLCNLAVWAARGGGAEDAVAGSVRVRRPRPAEISTDAPSRRKARRRVQRVGAERAISYLSSICKQRQRDPG